MTTSTQNYPGLLVPTHSRSSKMPIPGARFRTVKRGGDTVRLAFKGDQVVEAKNLDTGATHTQSEFAKDRAKAAKRRGMMRAVNEMSGRK